MKAIVLKEENQYPVYDPQFDDPETSKGKVLVKLAYAGMNRRDYWITQGKYPNIRVPVVLGSDGTGIVEDRKVIIYPARNWGRNKSVQSDTFQPLGMPDHGTFAEYIAIEPEYLYDAPDHLTMAEAGCLAMAGLTAYRALFTRGELKGGDRVLITGAGGGVALMACQFALAVGAQVYVTSGSDEKIARAEKLGVAGGYNYRNEGWHKNALAQDRLFDVIIDSAGGDGFAHLIKLAAPAGRIVTYGGTRGKLNDLSTPIIFWRQLSILGSTMGSPAEFKDMLKFVSKYQIRPIIHRLYHWDTVDDAFDALRDSSQFGKLVFSLE